MDARTPGSPTQRAGGIPTDTDARAAPYHQRADVSSHRSGEVEVVDSILRNNNGDGFSTHPGVFFLSSSITFTRSVVE